MEAGSGTMAGKAPSFPAPPRHSLTRAARPFTVGLSKSRLLSSRTWNFPSRKLKRSRASRLSMPISMRLASGSREPGSTLRMEEAFKRTASFTEPDEAGRADPEAAGFSSRRSSPADGAAKDASGLPEQRWRIMPGRRSSPRTAPYFSQSISSTAPRDSPRERRSSMTAKPSLGVNEPMPIRLRFSGFTDLQAIPVPRKAPKLTLRAGSPRRLRQRASSSRKALAAA